MSTSMSSDWHVGEDTPVEAKSVRGCTWVAIGDYPAAIHVHVWDAATADRLADAFRELAGLMRRDAELPEVEVEPVTLRGNTLTVSGTYFHAPAGMDSPDV